MGVKIDPQFQGMVKDYQGKANIEGVEFQRLRVFPDDRGSFCEQIRLSEDGDFSFYNHQGELISFKDFKIRQINSSVMRPGVIKAWHYHLEQTDVWTVAPGCGNLLVGLVDLREDSPTKGNSMRVFLGDYNPGMLRIPSGLAHGCMNINNEDTVLTYYVNQLFDPKNPDEQRLDIDFTDFHWGIMNG